MFYIKGMKNYKLNYNIKMYQNILIFKIYNINYLNFFNDYFHRSSTYFKPSNSALN